MAEYIMDPLVTDEDALIEDAVTFLQTRWPDWTPSEGNLETWLIRACARMVAEARDVASDVPPAIFRFFGEKIFGLFPIEPTSSIVSSTWTLNDNPDGRTIEAGTQVGIVDSDQSLFAFEVVESIDIGPTVLVTGSGEVLLRSIDEGSDTSGIGGTGADAQLIDGIGWVDAIVLTGPSSGGHDGESDDEYLNRLATRLTLLTPRPILPSDFEILAIDVAAQEGQSVRAIALDGYNPANQTFNNERMVAIAMINDETGENAPTLIKNAVDSELQALREVNFVVNVIDPTRTTIDVTVIGVALPGYDVSIVDAAVEGAIQAFLSDINWGSFTESGEWINQTVARHQDLSAVVNNVAGFSHWTTLTWRKGADAFATTDITLTGAVPLPTPGVLSVTVT
jgi:hypothetical protein